MDQSNVSILGSCTLIYDLHSLHYGNALEPRSFVQEIGKQSNALEGLKFSLHCCLSQLNIYAHIHFRMAARRCMSQALMDTRKSWSHYYLLGPILTYRRR